MRWTDFVSIVVGAFIELFGWVIVIGAALGWKDVPADEVAGVLGLVGIFGVAPILLGTWLIVAPFRRRSRRRKEELERQILELAASSGGTLTASDLARSSELTLEESKNVLNDFQLGGFCTAGLRDDGQIVYEFGSGTMDSTR